MFATELIDAPWIFECGWIRYKAFGQRGTQLGERIARYTLQCDTIGWEQFLPRCRLEHRLHGIQG